jgi:hypothetical protein
MLDLHRTTRHWHKVVAEILILSGISTHLTVSMSCGLM